MKRYHFIHAQRAKTNLNQLCKTMNVSRSGFYNWLRRTPSNSKLSNDILDANIRDVFEKSNGRYGYRRVFFSVQERGIQASKNRIQRRMRVLDMRARRRRAWKKTTNSKPDFTAVKNILARNFMSDKKDRAWVTDVTFVQTKEGWLYLSIFLDLWSRKIIGWSMGDKNDTGLAVKSLKMAVHNRRPEPGWIHHSDQGTPYKSARYKAFLNASGAVRSLSKRGDCFDNAVAESFFGRLKSEMIYLEKTFPTRRQARLEILKYLMWYNSDRLHSTLGYVSPNKFEKEHVTKLAA